MTELRVAIISAGVIAAKHAHAYAHNDRSRIVAVVDTDVGKEAALADQYGAKLFADYREMFAGDRVDAVRVCVPHNLHHEVGITATQAGAHILMEKPISVTLEEADAIIYACAYAHVQLMLSFVHRFREELMQAKRMIDGGQIGRPAHALDNICSVGGMATSAWVWQREAADGGVLMYGGIYSVDQLRWLMGSKIREVYARELYYDNTGNVEDGLSAILQFENAPTYGNPGGWMTTTLGDRGALRMKNGEWLEFTAGREQTTRSFAPYDHFQREIDEFVAAIAENRVPMITGKDGRRALAVAQAIYRSANSGAPVVVS